MTDEPVVYIVYTIWYDDGDKIKHHYRGTDKQEAEKIYNSHVDRGLR